ncbi:hypothetical protein CIT25_30155 [Mesorhizobium mediterraneum]|uniref:CDP-diacylglycerol--serine O-phosphatidyltransferase n=2 Tax=Phyllobacteriaceae TaxID=69277 RepID=A0AB36R291_9HYPH|nr:hypothetical protein CIT25_30155 [Mesorhizobium mediterraneum]
MVAALMDLPNIITLFGLCMSVIAIISTIKGKYELSLIFALFAVASDWVDGWVATWMRSRAPHMNEIGANLDSFADLVSSAIYPMVVVVCVSPDSVLNYVAAMFIACTGILRLSFFNVYGATPDGKVLGLPIAHNVLAMAAVVALASWLQMQAIWSKVAALYVLFAVANVSPFYFPRESPKIVPAVLLYIAAMCFLLWELT